MEEQHEVIEVYRALLTAHSRDDGSAPEEQKHYLWALAQDFVSVEGLKLRWGVKAENGVLPRREFKSRMLAQDAVEQSREPTYLVRRWSSSWSIAE